MPTNEQEITIPINGISLQGTLALPPQAGGIIIFVHGSGSSRHSPRNRYVAGVLNESGLGTLLFDLLTLDEEAFDAQTGTLRFDIGMLAGRLLAVTDWLSTQDATRELKTGYFGASTGGGAALVAAAERPDKVACVVSRGGRPDLAGTALPQVKAPTLLIVGANDVAVIGMNQEARAQMKCETELKIVPAASHLFSEPGKLEEVAQIAADWLKDRLS